MMGMSDVSSKPLMIDEREYYTAMSHFYRGEMSRIMTWRQRLDMTSNWAVLTSTALITFALSHPEITHLVFLIGNALIFLLLIIEGRRYRYYDAFRARVRMLEAHFLVPVIMRSREMIEGDWRHMLAEDMLLPAFKIGVRESIARRLKRNYIWIFVVMQFAWAIKIFVHNGPIHSFSEFIRAAIDGQPLPHWVFGLMIGGFYATVLWLVVYAQKDRYASGEMQRPAPSRPRWKI